MNLKGFCRLWQKKACKWALTGLFGALALFVVVSGTERALRGSSEFMGFRRIVQVSIVQNKDQYQHIAHVRAYPPSFPIFWSPFGLFPIGAVPDKDHPLVGTSLAQQVQLGASAALVLVVMVAMTVWAARCVTRACREPDGLRADWCAPVLLWVCCGGLMLNAIARAETDMFVVMLVAGAMYLMFARNRPAASGALLGIAAAFKLTPALFGVYLLCRRKWRAAGAMIAAGLVCTVMLPALVWGVDGAVARHRSWVTRVLIPYGTRGPEAFIGRSYRRINQSPKAALVRYLTHYDAGRQSHPRYVNVADLSMATVSRMATGVKVIILGALLVAWLLPPARPEGDLGPVLFALVPLGMLLLSDVSHGSHLAVLVIPFGALSAFCFRHAGRRIGSRISWGTLAGFVLASLIAVKWLKEMSVGTAGLLLLWGLTLYVAFRLHREGRSKAGTEAAAPVDNAADAPA